MAFGQSGNQSPSLNLKDVEQVVGLLKGVDSVLAQLKDKKFLERTFKEFDEKIAKAEESMKKEAALKSENLRLLKNIESATEANVKEIETLKTETKKNQETFNQLNIAKGDHLQNVKEFNAKVLDKEKELSDREISAQKMTDAAVKTDTDARALLAEGQALKDEYDRRMKILAGG